jgi:hypothetical protein
MRRAKGIKTTHKPDGCSKTRRAKGGPNTTCRQTRCKERTPKANEGGEGREEKKKANEEEGRFVLTLLTQIGNTRKLQSLTHPHDMIIGQNSRLIISRVQF